MELLERQRDQSSAHDDRQQHDRPAPRPADHAVEELQDRLEDVDQRLEDVRGDEHGSGARGRRSGLEQPLILDGIEALRGSTDCIAATASRPGSARGVCRISRSPARRTPSTTGSTCTARRTAARTGAGRRGSAAHRGPFVSTLTSSRPLRPGRSAPPAHGASRPDPHAQPEPCASGRATTTASVPAGRRRDSRRERLAQQALDAVALDRAADLARHRQAQAWLPLVAAGKDVQNELAAGVRAASPEDPVEVGAARQPPPAGPRPGAGRSAHQTVRRLRPLSRRRFSVSRPARVLIRARKPCVRARLRFFG